MNRPPLHALLGFATAARLGNLTRAAETMNLTVSALSHQIRTLEDRLGRRLFERGPRGVRLTPDGDRLLSVVAPHLDALDHALRPYSPRRNDVLTLSLMASMASSWLVPRLGGFVARHPQLELNLFSTAASARPASSPTSTTPRPCTAPRSRAWAWPWAGWPAPAC